MISIERLGWRRGAVRQSGLCLVALLHPALTRWAIHLACLRHLRHGLTKAELRKITGLQWLYEFVDTAR